LVANHYTMQKSRTKNTSPDQFSAKMRRDVLERCHESRTEAVGASQFAIDLHGVGSCKDFLNRWAVWSSAHGRKSSQHGEHNAERCFRSYDRQIDYLSMGRPFLELQQSELQCVQKLCTQQGNTSFVPDYRAIRRSFYCSKHELIRSDT
jgi:hypothetical protein